MPPEKPGLLTSDALGEGRLLPAMQCHALKPSASKCKSQIRHPAFDASNVHLAICHLTVKALAWMILSCSVSLPLTAFFACLAS